MLIFQIFSVPSMIKDAKEASNDPTGFSSRFLLKNVRGSAILTLSVIVFFLAVTFIFGYTSLIVGPYGIVKFFFWLFVIPSFFVIPFLVYAIRAANRALKNFPKKIPSKVI